MVAHLALHLAAPHELALALLLHVPYSRLVAAAAAQQLAAVDAVRRLVAQPSAGAHDAEPAVQMESSHGRAQHTYNGHVNLLVVLLAIVGRVLRVDQVRFD